MEKDQRPRQHYDVAHVYNYILRREDGSICAFIIDGYTECGEIFSLRLTESGDSLTMTDMLKVYGLPEEGLVAGDIIFASEKGEDGSGMQTDTLDDRWEVYFLIDRVIAEVPIAVDHGRSDSYRLQMVDAHFSHGLPRGDRASRSSGMIGRVVAAEEAARYQELCALLPVEARF
ncbi:hypothetical protein FWC63_01920 [Candidatus Saccharibacteria bacterium]|nr:hypothetical protein [Candidatus Saccharibacteria bacterium]